MKKTIRIQIAALSIAAALIAGAAIAADWSDRLIPGGGAGQASTYGALGVTAGGTGVTSSTGTGSVVLSTSPTLVTPTLGVATATSLNGNTFTTGTYTLTGTAAKTLNFTNTLTLSGTDSTTMTFPTTSATVARTDAANSFSGTQTFTGAIAPTSTVGIVGTITNDNPTAGNVGEVLKATVAAGSPVSETTATPVNITSLSLTVGDWEVTGACDRTLTGTTATIYGCSLSGTTGTLSTQPAFTTGNITCSEESFTTQSATFGTTVTGRYDTRVGPIRCQVTTASTTIFLVGGDTFSAGTVGLFGTIRARRLR